MGIVADVANLCRTRGVKVVFTAGCANRGNGSSWLPVEGIINHHTAGGRNVAVDQILINGRPDLSGPLCNFAIGYDGTLYVVSEGPANHAGASGGWDTAPLTKTTNFNPRVMGVEIQYPGTEPMAKVQWNTLAVLNWAAVRNLQVGRGEYNRVKTHNGTSIQGKWDPGYALPSKTYDVNQIRRAAMDIEGVTLIPPGTPSAAVAWGGAIKAHYDSTPGLADLLGAPSPALESVTPDGRARYTHFERGSIYWHPVLGAWSVRGAIRDAWAAQGWEAGALGLPVFSDEREGPQRGWRVSLFEHGFITWDGTSARVWV